MSEADNGLPEGGETPVPEVAPPEQSPEPVGEVRPGDLRIYLQREVAAQVDSFAGSDTTRQLGGVLLGKIAGSGEERQLTISAALTVRPRGAEETSLSFTPEVWAEIYREKAERYPQEKIVGWWLTHPGTGLGLSNYDISLAKYHFTLPWQVIYVVDPAGDRRGFYQWADDTLAPVAGYWLYTDAIELVPPAAAVTRPKRGERKQVEQREAERAPQRGFGWLSVALNVVLLVLAAVLFINNGRLQQEYRQRVAELEELAQEAFGKLGQAYDISDARIAGVAEAYSAKDARIAELEAELARLRGEAPAPSAPAPVVASTHTVVKGDTLTGISYRYYGDETKLAAIMELNGIANPNLIKVGDVLKLPPK